MNGYFYINAEKIYKIILFFGYFQAYKVGKKIAQWFNKKQREQKLKKNKDQPEEFHDSSSNNIFVTF